MVLPALVHGSWVGLEMAKVLSANFWLIETFSNNLKHIQSMNPWVQPGNMGNILDISAAWLVATCIISQRHLEHSVSCKSAISKVKIIQSNWVQPNWGRSCLNMFYYVLKKEKLEVLDEINLWIQDVPHILSIENIKRKVGRTQGPNVFAVCFWCLGPSGSALQNLHQH